MTMNVLIRSYVLGDKLSGSVLKSEVKYKNLVNAKDLTPVAFTLWKIMVINVLPQGEHLNDVNSFRVCLLRMFTNQR